MYTYISAGFELRVNDGKKKMRESVNGSVNT
jgi:hypothetical protein